MSFFKGLKKGMAAFGERISLIINIIFLLMVYLIGVGIPSIIAKLVRKKFLLTKLDRKRDSYWENFDLKKKPLDEYHRQF